jgi:surface polysaccharide O-acyltransferase-like enzyme
MISRSEAIIKNQDNKIWINELDFLRAFAVLAVIIIHTAAKFKEINSLNSLVLVNIFIDVVSHFAVPVFILISGIVLSYNYYENINYKSYYIKRFFSIIPQFLFFSIFYLVFSVIMGHRNPSFSKAIDLIISGESSYHLWFFVLLIQFYLIYPLLIKLYLLCLSRNKLSLFIILPLIIQILFYFLSVFLPAPYNKNISSLIDYYIHNVFISHIFYFVLGIHFGRNIKSMNNYINNINDKILYFLLILSNVSIYIIKIKGMEIYGTNEINTLFLLPIKTIEPLQYILSFILLWKISSKLIDRNNFIVRLLKDIGRFSFGIYLVHVFFIIVLTKILEPYNITFTDWIYYPIIFFCVSILSYLTCKIISFAPFSYYIIGIRSTSAKTGSPLFRN